MHMFRCLSALLFVAAYASALTAKDASILDYGAVPNSKEVLTTVLQAAIDDISKSGGGRLIVPSGIFKTGALTLKQSVELHLEEGAVLLGSTNLEDYPKVNTRIEGHFEPWRLALINAHGLGELKISGSGALDGNGKPFWGAFWQRRAENPKCTNLEVERPRLMFISECSNVSISGIHLKDSGFWNLHIYRCQDVTIDGIDIRAPHGDRPQIVGVVENWDEVSVDRAPSSDGIDVDSCQRVTIRNTTISVGDDCIALKGTKGPLALQDETSPPVEDISIENCHFESGHGVLTCGSEATIVKNVKVSHCTVGAGIPLVRLKLRPDTPQLYSNLSFSNIELRDAQCLFDVKPWTQFFDLQGHEPPKSVVENVVVENVTGSAGSFGDLAGNSGDELMKITIRNCDLKLEKAGWSQLGETKDLKFENVRVNGEPFLVK